MLSLIMFGNMNRSEQENLYRTSRKLSLVPIATGAHPYGQHFDSDKRRSSFAKVFDSSSTKCRDTNTYSDSLVLSVLKSPVNQIGAESKDVTYGHTSNSDACREGLEDDIRYNIHTKKHSVVVCL